MGAVISSEEWLYAQNRVIGAALLDPALVSRVVTELMPEDFTGNARAIYDAMATCFRGAAKVTEITLVSIAQAMGNTVAARQILAQYMELSPSDADLDCYLQAARQQSKLNRLRTLGQTLAETTMLSEAITTADSISNLLIDRPGLKRYAPADLMDAFALRHSANQPLVEWSLREINQYIRIKPGKFYIIGAEPSGGKTALALEQLWSMSLRSRVLFCSLETDEGTLFDRLISRYAGVPMDALESNQITGAQFSQVEALNEELALRDFQILPGAGLSVAGVKAAAIGAKADVVIIDYLQLLQPSSRRLSRYEAITEISMDLHVLAQTTGITVIALSQVTNRDPTAKKVPLGIHSARESGQIEADADAMLMLDKHIDKGLKESGCTANRILRIVKNKNGRCCNIPLYFDGRTQKFSRAYVPNPEWEQANAPQKKSKSQQSDPPMDDFEQISMDEKLPF